MGRKKRAELELRPVRIEPGFLKHPEGSALVEFGDTRVVCAASVEPGVKEWMRGKGRGWITAEYAMLPRANARRGRREGQFGRWPSGRSQEIQRLIGRSLRAAVWPARIGEHTITVDCDVLQADGGTRTASITGGFVALAIALAKMVKSQRAKPRPLERQIAAVSAGVVGGTTLVDLDYGEDSNAEVDLNVAADDSGGIVEVQGTAEKETFASERLCEMVAASLSAVGQICRIQRETLERAGVDLAPLIETSGKDS
ncbi:MAG: ribonuclease PH [Polyangia bacterium]